ncbi:hypothetical protein PAHAL_8G198200 [Panicum hallii]|uniref:Hydrophobic seed protein domain-containing protein n=1 Tax=Panicum hallii TaxID=206008 RepID=A0A2S3IF87_9POAL|nr:hypothetical protein PAHAL_8G198200 [Panicum hallii]
MALTNISTSRNMYLLTAALFLVLATMSSTFPSCQAVRRGIIRRHQPPPPPLSPSPPGETCFIFQEYKLSVCSKACVSKGHRGVGAHCVEIKQTGTDECCCRIKHRVL